MRKVLLALSVLSTSVMFLVSCGNNSHTTTPVVPTGNVAFLQKAPGASFAPVLGNFSGSSMTSTRITDPSTVQEVYGNFGSIILSPSGKKATFDLYGGSTDVPTNQWDI